MKKWLNGREYISTDGLAREFTKDYGFKVSERDIHQVCGHYRLPKKKNSNGIVFYPSSLIAQMRTMKEDFMKVLYNIVNYGDCRGEEAYLTHEETPREEENLESDMNYVNNELLNKYQFESNSKVNKIINEIINDFIL